MSVSPSIPFSLKVVGAVVLGALIVSACSSHNGAVSDLSSSLTALDQKNDEMQEQLAAKEAELAQTKEKLQVMEKAVKAVQQDIGSQYWSLSEKIWELRHILEKMPGLSVRMAFVQEMTEQDGIITATLDYAEWFGGEEAIQAIMRDKQVPYEEAAGSIPSNFYVSNPQVENDKVNVDKEASIYILNGAQPQYMPYPDFVKEAASFRDRLFWFYMIDKKIVMIQEKYRP